MQVANIHSYLGLLRGYQSPDIIKIVSQTIVDIMTLLEVMLKAEMLKTAQIS